MSIKPIIATVCFCLALLMILFLVWPNYQDFRQTRQKIERAQVEIQRGEEYVSELQTYSERLEKKQSAMDKVSSSLPSEPGVPALLNFIRSTANDYGLTLKEIGSVSRDPFKEDINKVEMNVIVVGSYPSFKTFVRAVENSSRIIDIKNLSFRTPEDEEDSPRFQLRLVTYYYPQ